MASTPRIGFLDGGISEGDGGLGVVLPVLRAMLGSLTLVLLLRVVGVLADLVDVLVPVVLDVGPPLRCLGLGAAGAALELGRVLFRRLPRPLDPGLEIGLALLSSRA